MIKKKQQADAIHPNCPKIAVCAEHLAEQKEEMKTMLICLIIII